jgi:adrenodoxin-NADP+ reductase
MIHPAPRWPTSRPLLRALLRQKLRQHDPKRRFSCPSAGRARPLRVAIVGSGPAGFYTATRLLKLVDAAAIDMYERLPMPFGLVRYGVAPDHPEVKVCPPPLPPHPLTRLVAPQACQDRFAEVAALPNFTFIGNVAVGTDLPLATLRGAYDAVVLAHGGAARDRLLGIPGEEELRGVLAARDVVAWYNGVPGTAGFEDRLALHGSAAEDAVVVGQGNVALDVARVLLTPVGSLRATDAPEHAAGPCRPPSRCASCGK